MPVHRNETQSAAPKFSPGLVASGEILLRTIIDPEHLGQDGALSVAAISLKDIQERGWSVNRKKFTSLRRLQLLHSEKKSKKPTINRFFVLPVAASYFRQVAKTGKQDFVVIDDAPWGNPAHASVLLSSPCPDSKARLYRNQLMENLPKYVDVEKVFNPNEKFGHIVGTVKQLFAYARWYLRRSLEF